MMTRRYREGQLVRARRLRRATLQSVRDSLNRSFVGMLAAMDKFALMLDYLRDVGSREALNESSVAQRGIPSAEQRSRGAIPRRPRPLATEGFWCSDRPETESAPRGAHTNF